MTKIEEPYGDETGADETGASVNQRRHEPLPGQPRRRARPARRHPQRGAQGGPRGRAPGQQSSPGVQPAQPSAHEPEQTGPGKAVRDMMPGGPAPQGDVPDAPAVQVATAGVRRKHAGEHSEKPGPVRLVSNAVPGKPDGEVDTRP